MRTATYVLLVFILSAFIFNSKQADKKIEQTLIKHHWKVHLIKDIIDGQTINYYDGDNLIDGFPAKQKKLLIAHKVKMFFNPDLTYLEYWGDFKNQSDTLNRKWSVRKGILKITFDPPKSSSHYKPLLYGNLKVLACNDSILILKNEVLKKQWTRIVELHTYFP